MIRHEIRHFYDTYLLGIALLIRISGKNNRYAARRYPDVYLLQMGSIVKSVGCVIPRLLLVSMDLVPDAIRGGGRTVIVSD